MEEVGLCCAWQDFSEQIMNSFFSGLTRAKCLAVSLKENSHLVVKMNQGLISHKQCLFPTLWTRGPGAWVAYHEMEPCLIRESEVAQLCPTLCDPMDCSLPGFSLHGILQGRVLEWVAIPFSRGSSWSRDRTRVSWIPGRHFNLWATREALTPSKHCAILSSSRKSSIILTIRYHRSQWVFTVFFSISSTRV